LSRVASFTNVQDSTVLSHSRVSGGSTSLDGQASIRPLRDIDQPFVFDLKTRRSTLRLELRDTASPDSWRLLEPDLVLLCYDISQRLSLINLQRVVSLME
jgi:Ras homolog gene family, member A